MNKDLDVFLKRMLLYRMQYPVAGVLAVTTWYLVGLALCRVIEVPDTVSVGFVPFAVPLIFSLFNTITYVYSKHLAKRYGVDMFSDLDQDWLRDHQAFDAKAFGDIFSRLIQCRKIGGPYMLAVIIPAACINMYFAAGVGVIYGIGYFFYRMTYLDTAVSYKVPRAMGGGGMIVSKILDDSFSKKIEDLGSKLTKKE